LVTQICNAAGIVCRPSMPVPGIVRYTFTSGADRSSQTILSDQDLAGGFELSTAAARATHVVAGGSGEGDARLFGTASDGSSGLDRVESFYDVNNLTSASAVALAAQGSLLESSAETAVEFGRVLPAQWRYPDRFDLGDTITVEADGVRYPVLVDGVSFTVNAQEAQIRPAVGRTTNNEAVQIMRSVWGADTRFNTNIS